MATIPANAQAVNAREIAVTPESDAQDEVLVRIQESLRRLRFGAINIVVQEGIVVQIDRTEKSRIRKPSPTSTCRSVE